MIQANEKLFGSPDDIVSATKRREIEKFRKPILELVRDVIIHYLTAKEDIVFNNIGIKYISSEDLNDIRNMSYSEIIMLLKRFSPIGDSKSCPWCIVYNCGCCPYGKRHKICTSNKISTYRQIKKEMAIKHLIDNDCGIGIINFKPLRDLATKTRDMLDLIQKNFKDYIY